MGVVMDMKKYNVLALFTVVFLVACHGELEREERDDMIPMSFYANIETPKDSISTRTVLGGESSDSYRNVLWEYQDEIFVTNGAVSSRFVNVTEGKSEVALLEGELSQASTYYAAYPYGMVKSYSASGFKIELPSVQNYCHDGVSSDSFPMVAKSEGGMFSFLNLCGIFVLRLIGDETISSVTFSGKDISGKDISVAGNGTISMDYSVSPSLFMEESAFKSVTLKSAEGVRLSPTYATTFHIVLPVGTYNTFKLVIKATDGTIMTLESEQSLEIKRSNRTTAVPLTYSGIIHYQDLNESGETANCYIISEPGYYQFSTTKGNSSEIIEGISSAEVLWESFGTDITPSIGDIVNNLSYSDGAIRFSTSSLFHKGNAVIAVKDSSGTILWSWHIWLTDCPVEHTYVDDVIVLDRNLGATSAKPGDSGALGLIYQWGRKDPFVGSSSINSIIQAKATKEFPESEDKDAIQNSIEFSIINPTTYINGYDWYNGSQFTEEFYRWDTEVKTIYDPCPSGWVVPASTSVWKEAGFNNSTITYDEINQGYSFNVQNNLIAWYPSTHHRSYTSGQLGNNTYGSYWTRHSNGQNAFTFTLYRTQPSLFFGGDSPMGCGFSIRCVKENRPIRDNAIDLSSANGSANCYIVSESGDFKFKALKGNSNDLIDDIDTVEVLWESFGTSVTPSVGDLVGNLSHSEGYIRFSTPQNFREGNAVIAAKNKAGIILWSWHIWLTDKPLEQVYYNNAGTLMDRNLGATSALAQDVCSQGLVYQWGRKDPFLSSSSNSSLKEAMSTGVWYSESSTSEIGTISYSIQNPTTFIKCISDGWYDYTHDWCYSGPSSKENNRWASIKTIYDPCPAGWRVPDGGFYGGVWATAIGVSSYYEDREKQLAYDEVHKGFDFSLVFGEDEYIWYPTIASRNIHSGKFEWCNNYWSANSRGNGAENLSFNDGGSVYLYPESDSPRAMGGAVRCMKID